MQDIQKQLDRIESMLQELLKKKEKKKKAPKEDSPMNCKQFVEWCAKSSQRHVQLIGEWADTIEPRLEMKSQWQTYLTANLQHAKKLSVFTNKQIEDAFKEIEKDLKRGCEYQPAMSTLVKKLTK